MKTGLLTLPSVDELDSLCPQWVEEATFQTFRWETKNFLTREGEYSKRARGIYEFPMEFTHAIKSLYRNFFIGTK